MMDNACPRFYLHFKLSERWIWIFRFWCRSPAASRVIHYKRCYRMIKYGGSAHVLLINHVEIQDFTQFDFTGCTKTLREYEQWIYKIKIFFLNYLTIKLLPSKPKRSREVYLYFLCDGVHVIVQKHLRINSMVT